MFYLQKKKKSSSQKFSVCSFGFGVGICFLFLIKDDNLLSHEIYNVLI